MTDTTPEPVAIPIDGTLDLHAFAPRDVPSVVEEYMRACQEKGIYQVRVIHGKGRGVLRQTVHKVLERDPRVESFCLDPGPSSWGTTIVYLRHRQRVPEERGGK